MIGDQSDKVERRIPLAIRNEVNKGKTMNQEMMLGGYIMDVDGVRVQLPVVLCPSDENVDESLRKVAEAHKGIIVIRYQQTPDTGPNELEVYADAGNFMLMLNEFDESGDSNVRTLTGDDCTEDRFVPILGEMYPIQAVTRDEKLVGSILKAFVHAGNVSIAVLN